MSKRTQKSWQSYIWTANAREQRLLRQRARQYPDYAEAIKVDCEAHAQRWHLDGKRLSSGKLKRMERLIRYYRRAFGPL